MTTGAIIRTVNTKAIRIAEEMSFFLVESSAGSR